MILFYAFHGLLLVIGVAQTVYLLTQRASHAAINLFVPTLIAVSALSLLRLSVGRLGMRALALFMMLGCAGAIYDGVIAS